MAEESGKVMQALNKYFWQSVSAVLAIVLVVVLLTSGTGNGSVSTGKASEDVLAALNDQTGGGVTLVNVTEDIEGFYTIVVEYQGQKVPVYVTKDGKYLAQGIIPLSTMASAGEADSGENGTESSPQEQAPAEVPKSDKPKVELFVMSYCPYGLQAEKGIIPVVELLKDKIDFELKFVSYAMHPTSGEVEENTRQYCIQKEQESKLIPYLSCFVQSGNSSSCLSTAGVDKSKMDSCYNATDKQFNITNNLNNKDSWLSGRFPKYDVDLADNEEYGVQGSPTLVINGEVSNAGRSPSAILKAVCAAFNTAPSECSNNVSSSNPSPGFGSTSGTAASGGSCG